MSRLQYTTPQASGYFNGKPCPVYTGRFLGGSSVHNRLCYTRGSVQDFTEWSALGISGWTYDELLPFMVELETWSDGNGQDPARGKHGPIHVTSEPNSPFVKYRKRWNAAALMSGYQIGDYNGRRQTYFGDVQKDIRSGVRQSTDNVYLKPIMKDRKNLDVITFSLVTRILFNKAGTVATGVEYSRKGKLHKVNAAKEVILSAGSIGSPQVLLLSGIGPKRQLDKFKIPVICNLPGVGRNLQDHQQLNASVSCSQPFPGDSEVTQENYDLWKREKKGILAATRFFSEGYITTDYSKSSNDSQVWLVLNAALDRANPSRSLLQLFVEAGRVYSTGYLELKSTDPFDDVLINPRYLSNVKDSNNLISGLKTMLRLMNTRPFKEIGVKLVISGNTKQCSDKFEIYSDDWFYCYVQKNTFNAFHYTSTCKMGSITDRLAVVNDKLQVRGVKNLRVIDASVMPQLTRGPPNAASMMIGLKGADLIVKQYKL